MDRTSYAVSDLPHGSQYRIPQLPAFQAKTICSCISCHNSQPSGHNSQPSQLTPVAENTHHNHHPQRHFPHHHSSINNHLNTCTRTCFSQLASHLIPNIPATACSCFPHVAVQSIPPPPSYTRASPPCPCCRHSNPGSPSVTHYHHISRIHLTTDNITHHPPLYATAFAPPPLLHASWEPTAGTREATLLRQQASRRSYMSSSPSPTNVSAPEFHSHIHHHQQVQQHHQPQACSYNQQAQQFRPGDLRNIEQELHSLATRHYRRYSTRAAAYPYPSGLHFPSSELFIQEPLITIEDPTPLPMPIPYFIEEELESEPLEYDWLEINGRATEPKGIKKEQLSKLPSYYVTKKTLEEFNENDRCVVCMCEYEVEDRLRVLPCAHEFHCQCIDKWLSTNPTCPICRSVVEVT